MLSGPKGMKVSKEGEITWTPEANQVGKTNHLGVFRNPAERKRCAKTALNL
jgi:hypothetical protein